MNKNKKGRTANGTAPNNTGQRHHQVNALNSGHQPAA